MAYDYGFRQLENELIEVFDNIQPDFTKAEQLIMNGADINALGENREDKILSMSIETYLFACRSNTSSECDTNKSAIGTTMCEIIGFFLSHGFDVKKYNGIFGARCLYTLVLSTFDRSIINASKILFDAGAKNRTISDDADEEETPWDFVGSEGSFQDTCEGNHALGNLYEALYQVYKAADEGKSYDGIDSFECAIGKKILKVMASHNDKASVFYSMDLPEFKKDNCFTSDLYFVYSDGFLRTTQYADFWVDTRLPNTELIDVSEYFPNIVGSTIKDFSFSSRVIYKESTSYTQPITEIKMESGQCIKFSINFGEVENKNRAAFFELK